MCVWRCGRLLDAPPPAAAIDTLPCSRLLRDRSFGHAMLEITSDTTARFRWFRNQVGVSPHAWDSAGPLAAAVHVRQRVLCGAWARARDHCATCCSPCCSRKQWQWVQPQIVRHPPATSITCYQAHVEARMLACAPVPVGTAAAAPAAYWTNAPAAVDPSQISSTRRAHAQMPCASWIRIVLSVAYCYLPPISRSHSPHPSTGPARHGG